MKKNIFILFIGFIFISLVYVQNISANDIYKLKDQGLAAFNASDFETALKKWQKEVLNLVTLMLSGR